MLHQNRPLRWLLFLWLFALPQQLSAQEGLDSKVLASREWRSIGPANMGGRMTSLAVVESDPTTFYIGTASGGLVKSTNSGTTLEILFDKEKTVSVGDVAVSKSNPNIVWVGTGEANPRNSVTYGNGVYKSTDAGKSWAHMGLDKTFQIGKVLIHPTNPDVVYVGALGRLYGPNPERGLYKTTDGGKTWEQVLFVDDKTGVIDARMDPHDPDTLIVAMWYRKRDEYDGFTTSPPVPDRYGPVVTHGENGGLFKTSNGGKTWTRLNDGKNGLPTGNTGRIGLNYSSKTPGLIYAVIDTEKVGTGMVSTAYLGVTGENAPGGGARLREVPDDGPAAKAGLKPGDVITSVNDNKVTLYESLLDQVLSKKPGDKINLSYRRGKDEQKVEITLGDKAQPAPDGLRPLAGFIALRGTLKIDTVVADGPSDKAGMKPGDEIIAVNGEEVKNLGEYRAALDGKKVGEKVKLTVLRGKDKKELEVTLGPPSGQAPRGPARPYLMGLGGQRPNVTLRQGEEGYQTGGIYRSKDNGDTWERVNSLNVRPMYFSKIRVDPGDDQTIYLTGDTALWISRDGGTTFVPGPARGVHADHHALWINPKDSRHMIIATDGGAYITFDRGENWRHLGTLALGQYYHVATDNQKPYRVYGGLQDNGTWGGPSQTLRSTGPIYADWVYIRGGDGFVCQVDPTDPDLIYSESQNGNMGRRNLRTGESASIRAGRTQEGENPRFNWNTPFLLSNHNPWVFYCGAQSVYRSVQRGDNLKVISPELTRTKQGTLVSLSESPRTPDVIWAGSDDGYVWVTRDGGNNWTNVTENVLKSGVPKHFWVSTLEASRANSGRCYVALDAHRSDDDKPYLLVTEDYGANWKLITANLPEFGSSRVLREDIRNPNILYCGTEFGAFASTNRGEKWHPLGEGFPTVAIHEFAQPTTADEIVAATHGRSLWVLDVSSVRQLKPKTTEPTLFAPSSVIRWRLGVGGETPVRVSDRLFVGQNPNRGAVLEYFLPEDAEKVSLKLVDLDGKTVRDFQRPATKAGFHRVPWNLLVPIRSATGNRQTAVRSGTYRAVLTVGDKEMSQLLVIQPDPNRPADVSVEEWETEAQPEVADIE